MLLPLIAALISQPATYPAELVKCYDGDTCTIDIRLQVETSTIGMGIVRRTEMWFLSQKTRLCGVQAPEIRSKATKKAALKSRDTLLGWIRCAKKLTVKMPTKKCDLGRCPKKGKYGRWLVWLYADGVSLNEKMVEEGWARPYGSGCR